MISNLSFCFRSFSKNTTESKETAKKNEGTKTRETMDSMKEILRRTLILRKRVREKKRENPRETKKRNAKETKKVKMGNTKAQEIEKKSRQKNSTMSLMMMFSRYD